MTMAESHRLLLTAQQGDAEHREDDRDAANIGAIHSKNLHKTGTVAFKTRVYTVTPIPLLLGRHQARESPNADKITAHSATSLPCLSFEA